MAKIPLGKGARQSQTIFPSNKDSKIYVRIFPPLNQQKQLIIHVVVGS